ncbi:MAG: ATP-binding cassette domain-containing protein [Simkaniaceae bacterium]
MNNDIVVQAENLSKSFNGQMALQPISFSLPQGKLIGLVGPDGSGKTTLIRLLTGLLKPDFGKISILSIDLAEYPEKIHRRISYMPQRFGLYEDLSVMQNLDLYYHLHGLQEEGKKEKIEELLHFAGLLPFTARLAKNLSGGMKQKLGLACALLRKPDFMLLDEPSVGVDPVSRRQLWKMINDLVKDGIAVLCSTAYLDDAEKCDEVLLLNQGKLEFQGAPQELIKTCKGRTFKLQISPKEKRQTLFRLLQKEYIVDATIEGNSVRYLVKKNAEEGQAELSKNYPGKITPTDPRFEDGCIEMLGGAPKMNEMLKETLTRSSYQGYKGEIPVEAKSLTKKFGSFTAVDKVSFQVKKGEIFGLLGPNGAGKSTTFKMLCGIISVTEGETSIAGKALPKSSSSARAKIGYMAQKFSLYGNMTVQQNLDFSFGVYSNPSPKAMETIVDIFSLSPYLQVLAEKLPLGFKQRLALSCSLMHKPDILFLDEPTSGVDPVTRREFWVHINTLVEYGMTIVVTTHFMDEAEYCDRIGLITQGKLMIVDTPDRLKESMKNKQMPSPTMEDVFVHYSSQENKE